MKFFIKSVLMLHMLLAMPNVHALEDSSDDEGMDSSEIYNENSESSSGPRDENPNPYYDHCEKKMSSRGFLSDKDAFAFSYSKNTGPACCRNVFMHGEFLLFRPIEQGLEYAIEQDRTGDSENSFPLTNGNIDGFSANSKQWAWRPGGRIGLGFYSNLEKWNFEILWTYVNINDHSSKTRSSGVFLPLFLPPIQPSNIQRAKAHWSGNFNTFDVFMGKPYHVSRYFISNPSFGLKGAFINQDYHVTYYPNGTPRNAHAKNDYWGIGLRGFYEGQFILGCGWTIYGKAAYCLLFGKFDISQRADEIGDVTLWSTDYHTNYGFYDVQSNTELGFGLSFKIYSSSNQYTTLKLGYEIHQWLEQNQLRKFYDVNPGSSDTLSRGNLSLNGVMFEILLEF